MSKRMLKSDRREQLLSVAVSIIKNKGADALTLAMVAEEAGVTKPVAYNHFKTKENLLKQIYQNIDNRLIESIQLARESGEQSLTEVVSLLCNSYLDCMLINAEIYDLTVAALKGYPHNSELSKEIQDFFVNAYSDIFQLPVTGSSNQNRLKLIAVYGIIESIGAAVVSQQIPRDLALPYLEQQVIQIIQR